MLRQRHRDPIAPLPAPIAAFWRWLGLITGAGLVLRVVYALAVQHWFLTGDGFGYFLQANANAQGHWFLSPANGGVSALHPPAWSLLLTGAAALGLHTLLEQQLVAAVIGTITVTLVGVTGRRIAGDRAGLFAATIAAVWPAFWLWERALLSETLVLPVVTISILLAYRFREHPSVWRVVLLAGSIGLPDPQDESTADPPLRAEAWRYADAHLSRLPLVVFAREGRTWGFWDPLGETTFEADFQQTSH